VRIALHSEPKSLVGKTVSRRPQQVSGGAKSPGARRGTSLMIWSVQLPIARRLVSLL
jgi:hypothetical protein